MDLTRGKILMKFLANTEQTGQVLITLMWIALHKKFTVLHDRACDQRQGLFAANDIYNSRFN